MAITLNDENQILSKINENLKKQNKRDVEYKDIINQIISFINSGELQPGQLLPGERLLADAFDLGRSNVRVALKMLEFFGIIESKTGKGNFITNKPENLAFINVINLYEVISENPFEDIIASRIAIEPQMAALAALHRDDNDLYIMREALKRQEENNNIFTMADEFHCAIFKASKNNILIRICMMLNDLMHESRKISLGIPKRNANSIKEHFKIYHAIENKNSEDASKYMLEHLYIVKNNIIDQIIKIKNSDL